MTATPLSSGAAWLGAAAEEIERLKEGLDAERQARADERRRWRDAAAEMVQAYIDAEAGNEFNARMENAWKVLRALLADDPEPGA